MIFFASAPSLRLVHSASWLKTRSAMLAAAALVNVRHKIFAGGAPASRSLKTRCARTWVLPLPALAETQAEDLGFDARGWRSRSGSGMARGRVTARLQNRQPRRLPTIP